MTSYREIDVALWDCCMHNKELKTSNVWARWTQTAAKYQSIMHQINTAYYRNESLHRMNLRMNNKYDENKADVNQDE